MTKELSPLELAVAMLRQSSAAAMPPTLIGSLPTFPAMGAALVNDRPAPKSGSNRAGLFPGEFDDGSLDVKPRGTAVMSGSGEAASAVANLLAQQRRHAPAKVEPDPVVEELEPEPKTELQIANERLEQLADMKRRLASIARARGVDLNADPARAQAQALADAQKLVVDAAVAKRKEKAELKARRKILRGIR